MPISNRDVSFIQNYNLIEEEKLILEELGKRLKKQVPIIKEVNNLEDIYKENDDFGAIVFDRHIISLCLKKMINQHLDKFDGEVLIKDIFEFLIKLRELRILDISNNNISLIPNNIKILQKLESLIAAHNNFSEFPESISNLESINNIDLSHNLIQGIPAYISKFHSLIELNVSNNQINDIHSNIHVCRKLEHLNLSNNRLQFIPDFFRSLITLKNLNLSHNGIRGIDLNVLRDMLYLEVIDLSNNFISESSLGTISTLENLNKLKEFNLAKNNFNETNFPQSIIHYLMKQISIDYLDHSERYILAFFKIFIKQSELDVEIKDKHITKLNISFQDINFLPQNIGDLKYLRELNLRGNSLKRLPDSFKNLNKLRILNLSINSVLEIPDYIYAFENLKELNLSGCNLHRISEQIRYMKDLEILELSSNHLKKFHPSIKELNKLKILNLSYNEIEEIPEFLLDLEYLEELNLSNNLLNLIPNKISNLKALKTLNLNFNKIATLPEEISELLNLKNFYIIGNNLENIPNSFKNLKALEKLYLSNNKLNDIPESLSELRNLKKLYISNNQISNFYNDFLPDCSVEKLITLNQIYLKNIYSYKETNFENINQVALLVGTNNSGKSNFFKILLKIRPFIPIDNSVFFSDSDPEKAEIRYEFKFSDEFNYFFIEKLKEKFIHLRFINLNDLRIEYEDFELNIYEFLKSYLIYIRFVREGDNISPYIDKIGFNIKGNIFNLIEYKNEKNFRDHTKLIRVNWNNYMRTTGIPKLTLTPKNLQTKEIGNHTYINSSRSINELLDIEDSVIYFYLKEIWKFFENIAILEEHRNFEETADHIIPKDIKIFQDGHNFPQVLASFTSNQRKNQNFLLRLLRLFYPEIKDIWSESEGSLCYPCIQEQENIRYFNDVGKGLHQILVVLTRLIQLSENETLLIEEPELFIHPQLQKILMDIITKFLPSHQIFITTHSPFILNIYGDNCSLHHIQKISGNSIVKNINKDMMIEVIRDLGVNPSDVLMYNGIILVEGERDFELIGRLLKNYLIENHIEIREFEGKSKLHFIADHKLLSNLISKGFQYLIILDRDEGNKKIIEGIEVEDAKKHIILLPVREVENFYINPKIITEFLETYYKENFDRTDIEDYVNKVLISIIDEKIRWETTVKEFFDQIPLNFSREERDNFLTKQEKEKWFDEFFAFCEKKFLVKQLSKEDYISKFNSIEKEIENKYINKKENLWKIFPGKKIRPLLFKKLKSEKNVNISLEKLESLIEKDSFVIKELIHKIKDHFKLFEYR